jgi:ferric-dicitrate binding protein FerR (iron transport regulator)
MDRLEKALEEMRRETVDAPTLDAARARVWDTMTGAAGTGCAEFRPDFRPYLSGALVGSRRVLMDDHLSRCPACRASLAELKGERRVIAMPQRSSSRWARYGTLAAAAVLFLAVLYGARDTIDAMLAPGGPRATVVSAEGGLYRQRGEALGVGATIGEKEIVRSGPGAHALLQLPDGSTVDVNERTELFATAAWSGLAIHLQRGDVIVRAAKQRRGHLRVLTRNSIASVRGTVFAVSSGLGGSVVSVVEGSVAVSQPGRDVLLSPGQQAASNAALASSVAEAVAWSPSADEYLQLLASFVKIERQLAESFPTAPRNTSALLAYLPAGAFAYGAVPNIGGSLGTALALAEQQALENATFAVWWSSDTGQLLRQMVNRLQSVSALLGDEVVFCASAPAPGQEVPMVMARVQPGRGAELTRALDELFADSGEPALPYSVSGDLMVVSSSPEQLAWALGHLQQGAASPFAAAIGERYRRGTSWLMAIDAPAVIAIAAGDDAPPVELAAMIGPKYMFVEQRAQAGGEENELTLVFDGAKKGMASWLADSGAGGVAEYLPAYSLLAGYVSMQEPWQLFQEFTALMLEHEESFEHSLADVEEKLGGGFIASLTAALGNEAAVALNGFSLTGPRWTMAVLAYDPPVIDDSLRKFTDAFNAELAPDEQDRRIVFGQESAGGRLWNTMTAGQLSLGVTWTYDQGYLVAASDRATAERAIATRNGGSPLVWSLEFQGQLPASAGLHPSAFAWLNTKGALEMFSTLAPSPTVAKLLSERDPVLVVFDGKPKEIHAASRARLPGLILDVMLLESLTRAREELQSGDASVGREHDTGR